MTALYPNDAKKAGAKRILFLGLSLATNLLHAPLDGALIRKAKQDRMLYPLMQEITTALFSPRDSEHAFTRQADQFQPMHIKMRERLSDKIRHSLRVVTTPSVGEWAMIKLPRPLYFLYFALRPIRLLWKGIARTMGFLSKRKTKKTPDPE